jgi:hypothetical protein
MNEQLLQLVKMCIQLLQVVQKDIPVESLPKDWWISLGMTYNTYKYEVQQHPELTNQNPMDVSNNQVMENNENNS